MIPPSELAVAPLDLPQILSRESLPSRPGLLFPSLALPGPQPSAGGAHQGPKLRAQGSAGAPLPPATDRCFPSTACALCTWACVMVHVPEARVHGLCPEQGQRHCPRGGGWATPDPRLGPPRGAPCWTQHNYPRPVAGRGARRSRCCICVCTRPRRPFSAWDVWRNTGTGLPIPRVLAGPASAAHAGVSPGPLLQLAGPPCLSHQSPAGLENCS